MHQPPDQRMATAELVHDRWQQPLLPLISREDDIVLAIGIRCVHPRAEAAHSVVVADGIWVEHKTETAIRQPIGQLDVFGAAEVRIEPTSVDYIAPSQRCVARIKLPRSRLPMPK